MMSKKLEIIINLAIRKANKLRHEYLTLENVFYAMLRQDDQVKEALSGCGAHLEVMKVDLETFFKEEKNFSILSDAQIKELSKKQFVDEDLRKLAENSGVKYQPEISLALQRVIQRAAIQVQSSGRRQIKGIHLLISLFQEKDSFALFILQKQGVEKFDLIRYISHEMNTDGDQGMDLIGEEGFEEKEEQGLGIDDENSVGSSKISSKFKFLEKYTTDLNVLAREDQIDPIIGRKKEINRILQILCRRRKNNPLLVGDAGVGKTALAEGLAWFIEEKLVPKEMEKTSLFSLDMAQLLAGAKFRGDFEARLKGVIKDLEDLGKEGTRPILFIDEVHTLMGAGATNGGGLDASNLLKFPLASGKVRVVGSTTYEEFRRFIEKDSAFSRRFQKVDIEEPSKEDTYKILKGLRKKFESHHSVKYPDSILKTTVDLSERYLTDRKNPDKSIDIIDEAGAALHLREISKRKSKITKRDVERIISHFANIPKINVAVSEKQKLKDLKSNLKMLIYGQDKAIDKVADAILLNRSGLGNESQPIGSFLFAGPTGVGKTELAKQLAIQMDSHLERIDMSEFMEKHAVSKLIGAPPGYVGYDQGGLLTDALKKHPYCVLLFDEIEKAHPDVYHILLQVIDYGVLTDGHGRSANFRNSVIIMTTNAGAQEMDAGSIGLGKENSGVNLSRRNSAIKNFFTPEFRNRLDAIVHFNKLDSEFIIQIVEKFLGDLEAKLLKKNVTLEISRKAKKWLAQTGYDPKMGARPLSRLIDHHLKKPLSNEILFGRLEKGGHVVIELNKNQGQKPHLEFKYKVLELV